MSLINVVINGFRGRLGALLLRGVENHPSLRFAGGIDVGCGSILMVQDACVVIDFSEHSATVPVAMACARHNTAMVIGTTGHSDNEKAAIRQCAETIPIVWTTNYSTGVNVLFWLTRKAAEILGPGFDLEVIEMHHRLKKDAPSGTASTLAEILAEVRGLQVKEALRHGRKGITGERTNSEIGVHSLRGGDVAGDHTVIFAAIGERLELSHKASNPETFAKGALRAAEWIVGKPPGLYSMADVLNLK